MSVERGCGGDTLLSRGSRRLLAVFQCLFGELGSYSWNCSGEVRTELNCCRVALDMYTALWTIANRLFDVRILLLTYHYSWPTTQPQSPVCRAPGYEAFRPFRLVWPRWYGALLGS